MVLKSLANKGLGPLEDGQTVVVIGGGPGGTSVQLPSADWQKNVT
jgi:hypothetical protein